MRNGRSQHLRCALCFAAGAALLASIAGCALQRYQPAPLDPAASAQAYESRRTDTPGLKHYMVAHGHSESAWPVERWGLAELTLLAFYYHPELNVTRAQARAAHAEALAASQRAPIAITPLVEHHSREPNDASSPWSLGFEIEIPLGEGSRREAIQERGGYLVEAAELKVGSAAWSVRSEVRARLLDHYATQQELALLDAQRQQLQALTALLERRLEAGAVARGEVTNARLRQAELEGLAQAAALARDRTVTALSHALGVPLVAVKSLSFDFIALEQTPSPPDDAATQRTALLNRLDVRAKLLEYSAADAAVKLEVARQYPSFSISPGYLWDQGDNVWSVAAKLMLPAGGNKPSILAAEARREVAAQEFLALQNRVISEADGAQARYRSAIESVGSVARAAQLSLVRGQSAKKQFDAGQIDRVELTLAQVEALNVQRNALSVRTEAQRALGALEDALQIPLTGGPLPAWAIGESSSPNLAER